MPFRCVIHGSFRKHLPEIREAAREFSAAGIEVLAPNLTSLSAVRDGFVCFEGQQDQDPRMIELLYLHHLKRLGRQGFSYFVNPGGYLGKSASYELGIAQVTNVPCFFSARPADHPVYVHRNSIWSTASLASFILEKDSLPEPRVAPDDAAIHRLWEELMVPGSVVATGAIIRRAAGRGNSPEQVLLVKTHKWGGRYSMVGGKVRRNETLIEALRREVREETGLEAKVDRHLCTFDQIRNSGYYLAGTQHVFVDYSVSVDSAEVRLNDEAEGYVWLPAREALDALDIEPNARHTLQLYLAASGGCPPLTAQ